MFLRKLSWLYLPIILALLAILLLAASLSDLQLKEGALFERETSEELSLLLAQFSNYKGALLACTAFLPLLVLFFFLLNRTTHEQLPAARRSNLLVMLLQLIFLLLAFMVIRRKILENPGSPFNLGQFKPPEYSPIEEVPRIPVVFPRLLVFAVAFALLSIIVIVLIRIFNRRRRESESRELVQWEAFNALNDIQAGSDLRNVIVRCYYQMNQAVEQARGVRRREGMTPREFERQLVHLGITPLPVSQLTRLFEEVRYGGKETGPETEELARSCLSAIASGISH